MKFLWETEKYLELPEFCTRLINATTLQSQTPGCMTPLSPNSTTSLSATHLAVGQLPSVQQFPQIRDPEWLKVEVCREFQRGACKRSAEECRYAHPGKNIQVSPEGKVIACYDALKGKCNRDSCKYLHPTYQLKQQLEITGRQTLIQNRAMLQQMLPVHHVHTAAAIPPSGLFGYEQIASGSTHQLAGNIYSPSTAITPQPSSPTAAYGVLQPSDLATLNQHIMPYYQLATTAPTQIAAMLPAVGGMRADKLEVCRDFLRGNCTRGEFECRYGHPHDRSMIDTTDNTVTVCMDCIKGRCIREKCKYFHPPSHLIAKIRASQNPGSTFIPSISPTSLNTQPAMMVSGALLPPISFSQPSTHFTKMTNATTAIGQPPLKRHALETSMINSNGNGIGTSPCLSTSSSNSPNTLAALCGYGTTGLPVLSSLHHQALAAAPGYYQQALPMLHLQYGGTAGALTAAPAAPASSLAALNLPNTSTNNVGAGPAYAFLNGQNQLAVDGHPMSISAGHTTTLTVCRDYQSGKCTRPYCRFVHVQEDYVEVKDDKVTICQNALQGTCDIPKCKFYHYPNLSMPNLIPTNFI